MKKSIVVTQTQYQNGRETGLKEKTAGNGFTLNLVSINGGELADRVIGQEKQCDCRYRFSDLNRNLLFGNLKTIERFETILSKFHRRILSLGDDRLTMFIQ